MESMELPRFFLYVNNCYKISKIQPIFNWGISKGIHFEKMFGNCVIYDSDSIVSSWSFANKRLVKSNMSQLFKQNNQN